MGETFVQPEVPPSFGVGQVALFVSAIEGAATLLQAAHSEQPAVVAKLSCVRPGRVKSGGWRALVLSRAAKRAVKIIEVLVKHPANGGSVVPEREAFRALLALTPEPKTLARLAESNLGRAYDELSTQIGLLARQLQATTEVDEYLEAEGDIAAVRNAERFAKLSEKLLQRAGGGLSLTDAAKRLGITRQAMHKSISSNRALGMMSNGVIVVPAFQFTERNGKPILLPGVDRITKLFHDTEVGGWAELQFLLEADPNLRGSPIEALRSGKADDAINAARAYLRMDEG